MFQVRTCVLHTDGKDTHASFFLQGGREGDGMERSSNGTLTLQNKQTKILSKREKMLVSVILFIICALLYLEIFHN